MGGRRVNIISALTLFVNILAAGVGVIAGVSLWNVAKTASQTASPQGVRLGRSLNVDFSKAKGTLLIVVQKQCSFCSSEMNFYRELVARRDTAKVRFQVVVVAPVTDGDISDYLESQRLKPDSVVYDRGGELPGIAVTPTVLLTDSTGQVIDTWAGALGEDGRQAVRERLF